MKRLFYDNKNRTSQKQSQQLVLTNLPNLSEAHLSVFNLIISLSNRYISVYARQSTIAKYSGYCRQYVNEIINDLKEWGYIDTWYRHMTSCVYYLNPIFNEGIIRRKYASILPALALFTISWLKAPDRETTQLSLFNYYVYLTNHTNHTNLSVSTKRDTLSITRTIGDYTTKKIDGGGYSKKESLMKHFERYSQSEYEKTKILKLIDQFQPYLNTTRAGKVKVLSFPDEAIWFGIGELKKNSTVKDPFKYFLKLAWKWCSENIIMPDHQFYYRISVKEQFCNNPEMVLPIEQRQPYPSIKKTSQKAVEKKNFPTQIVYSMQTRWDKKKQGKFVSMMETRKTLQEMKDNYPEGMPLFEEFCLNNPEFVEWISSTTPETGKAEYNFT